GDLSLTPTLYQPAMWNTPSAPSIPARMRSFDAMSPSTSVAPIARSAPALPGSRTSARTLCPPAVSWRATSPPTKPVAPVRKYSAIARPSALAEPAYKIERAREHDEDDEA